MSQEIIYTSAPQGLRAGSFGFCTVATTPGMAASLAERLEALSGYRHVYPPGHSRAPFNPVAYSHVLLKVGGQRLHVLSRVADAGLDYSQRSNKLAHHVALEPAELVPAGPAWVLAQLGFSETAWSGTPRILPAGRKPPAGELPSGICHAWQRLAGDAGWAGILAQNGLDAKRPAYLIVPEGADVLTLIIEAQALLPPIRRWEVSFSTYYTRLPPGIDCQWRCVVAGTPEAQSAAGLRGELVLDLTRSMGHAPDGPLVTAARTGLGIPPPVPAAAGLPQPPRSDLLVLDESTPPVSVRPSPRRVASHDDDLRLAPPPPPTTARRKQHVSPLAEPSLSTRADEIGVIRRSRWLIPTLATSLVLSLIANAVLVMLIQFPGVMRGLSEMDLAFLNLRDSASEPPAPGASAAAASVSSAPPATNPATEPAKIAAPGDDLLPAAPLTPGPVSVPAPASPADLKSEAPKPAVAAAPESPTPAKMPNAPIDDVQLRWAEEPMLSFDAANKPIPSDKHSIKILSLTNASPISSLALIGNQFGPLVLKVSKPLAEKEGNRWDVTMDQSERVTNIPVGQFVSHDTSLEFSWAYGPTATRDAQLLCWCLLFVEHSNGATALVRLNRPATSKDLSLTTYFILANKCGPLPIPIPVTAGERSIVEFRVPASFPKLFGMPEREASKEVTAALVDGSTQVRFNDAIQFDIRITRVPGEPYYLEIDGSFLVNAERIANSKGLKAVRIVHDAKEVYAAKSKAVNDFDAQLADLRKAKGNNQVQIEQLRKNRNAAETDARSAKDTCDTQLKQLDDVYKRIADDEKLRPLVLAIFDESKPRPVIPYSVGRRVTFKDRPYFVPILQSENGKFEE